MPQLLLTTAYGYNDATYDDFVSDVLTNTDYSGNRLPYSSKHNFSATAQYDQPLAEGVMLSARGEYVYRGATFSDQANTPLYQNDDYNIVNARLGVSFADPAIELTVWARNLFDERYTRDLFGGSSAFSPGAYGGFIGDPRTYGFELRKKF